MQWWTRLKTFLSEVLVETRKVTWPTKQEVINTTTVVVIASFIFGIYLYLCDLVFVFLTQKIATALFYAQHILPECATEQTRILHGAQSLLDAAFPD